MSRYLSTPCPNCNQSALVNSDRGSLYCTKCFRRFTNDDVQTSSNDSISIPTTDTGEKTNGDRSTEKDSQETT